MRLIARPAPLVAALAVALNAACYAYQPVTVPPNPTSTIRLHLSTEGTDQLARYLGPNVAVVTGDLAQVLPAGTLLVSPRWVRTRGGVEQPWSGEGTVQFPREYVTQMESRTFMRGRTIVASTAVTAGLVGIAITALKTGGASGSAVTGGGAPPP